MSTPISYVHVFYVTIASGFPGNDPLVSIYKRNYSTLVKKAQSLCHVNFFALSGSQPCQYIWNSVAYIIRIIVYNIYIYNTNTIILIILFCVIE